MADSSSGGEPRLTATIDGHIATLTVDNPRRRNAVTGAMWAAMPGMVAGFEANPVVRVILVRGVGEEAFSAGADISEFAETRGTVDAAKRYDAANARAYASLRTTKIPTVAMIHGFCFGGGLGLAACCDLRIGSTESLYSVPAARLGLAYPTDSLRHLANIAGPGFAKELLFVAGRVTARRAYDAGFLNQLVEPAELEEMTMTLCRQIADNAPLTVRAAKFVIDAATWSPDTIDTDQVKSNAEACYGSSDYEEGRRAFMEKRRPVFQGK